MADGVDPARRRVVRLDGSRARVACRVVVDDTSESVIVCSCAQIRFTTGKTEYIVTHHKKYTRGFLARGDAHLRNDAS